MAPTTFLMDCQMPELDGFDAPRAIREPPDRQELPIIALTANVLPADRRACTDAGMNDFLSKPVRQEQLREALVRWTRSETGVCARSEVEVP